VRSQLGFVTSACVCVLDLRERGPRAPDLSPHQSCSLACLSSHLHLLVTLQEWRLSSQAPSAAASAAEPAAKWGTASLTALSPTPRRRARAPSHARSAACRATTAASAPPSRATRASRAACAAPSGTTAARAPTSSLPSALRSRPPRALALRSVSSRPAPGCAVLLALFVIFCKSAPLRSYLPGRQPACTLQQWTRR
jgi:hypothetical protein